MSDPDHARESEDERKNRQLQELLNELRVALPGVQMLFGFLLAVPFTQRFGELSSDQRWAYYTAFVAAALASVCFIAPTSFHRIVWRRHLKQSVVRISSALTIAGTVFLAAAILGAVALVTSVLFASPAAIVAVSLVGTVLAVLWYVMPLAYRILSVARSDHNA